MIRKLISFVLSAVMLCTMVSFSVSAVETVMVSSSGITTIEMENYINNVTKNVDGTAFTPSASPCDNIGLSGGYGLRNTYQTCEGGYTITVPVTVEQEGIYKVTALMTDNSTSTSKAVVSVDGTPLFSNTTEYRTTVDRKLVWPQQGLLFFDYAGSINLTAGNHTITVNVACREEVNTQILFVADYIKIESEVEEEPELEYTAISSEETTILEMEDYVDSVKKNADGTAFTPSASTCDNAITLSGGKALRNTYQTCVGGYTVTIPVSIEEANTYTITALMTEWTQYTSKATISVDGEELLSNAADYKTTSTYKLYWSAQGLLFFDYTAEVALTAGKHIITINVANREAEPNQILFVADYLKFEPELPTEISATETTVLEAEDYVNKVTKNSDGSPFTPSKSNCDGISFSGGYALRNTYQSCEGGYTVTIPFTVVQENIYTITALLTDKTEHTSKATVSVDGEELFANTAEHKKSATAKLSWSAQGLYFYDYEGEMTLTEGNHTLTIEVLGRDVAPAEIVFIADCISFTPVPFEYDDINAVIEFYNTLDSAETSAINGLITGDSNMINCDFSGYVALDVSVLPLADAEIASWDLATNISKIRETDNKFKNLISDLIKRAQIADPTTTDEDWDVAIKNAFEIKFASNVKIETIRKYFGIGTLENLDKATLQVAVDKAEFLSVAEELDYATLNDAFDYHLQKGTLTIDSDKYAEICQKGMQFDLFKKLKEFVSPYESIAAFETACNEAMANLLVVREEDTTVTPPKAPMTGGGGGGGSTIVTTNKENIEDKKETEDKVTPVYFADSDDAVWAKEAVGYLAGKGVLSGRGDGKFYPNDTMTREEFIKLVILAFDATNDKATADFNDVSKERWSYPYIAAGVRHGLINGVSGNEFDPTGSMTREDMAVVIYRACNLLGINNNTSIVEFNDNANISGYAKEAVEKLAGLGIVNGMGNGTFAPKETVTRAQAAKIVYELLVKIGGVK